MASQARHELVSPIELCASRNVVPKERVSRRPCSVEIESLAQRQTQRGSTVIVLMILLSIMLALVTANLVSVRTLNRELILLNKKQEQRWQKAR
jgi:hypothetical protein